MANWADLQNKGWNTGEIQSLAQAGYTADQALQAFQAGQLDLGASQAGVVTPTSGALLALLKGGGQQGGGSDMGGGGLRNYQTVGVDPNQPFTNLGAAALNQNAIYNPQPGAGTGGDTGVTGSGGSGFAGGGGLTIGGVSTTTPRITTSGVVPKAPTGPWSNTPSLFNKAPMPTPTAPLPVTPTPQATGMAYQPGRAWATPPPAPGITFGGGAVPMPMGGGQMGSAPQNWQGAGQVPPSGIPSGIGALAAAHNSALADAGQALFAHFGGDPSSASPADIAHFHTQLTGVISGSASPGAIALQSGSDSKKMNTGGRVSGQGNPDSVPAMLTPGEYVLNKNAVGQIGLDRLNQMNQPVRHMQSGGEVKLPPETRHQRMVDAATRNKSVTSDTPQPTSLAQDATQSSSGGLGGGFSFQDLMAMRQQHQANVALNSGGASGGGYSSSAPGIGSYYVGASPGAGQSGYIYPNQAAATAAGDVGTGVGGGGGGAGAAGAASAIGGIGSAIAKAAQTYADSIKSWQMQKSAIPNPDDFRQQPQITLQQPGLV